MHIRVRVCPRRIRERNRSRQLPLSLQFPLAGCVSENVHLSLRFLLAMRCRAASASLSRPWEYNQRGDSGTNLKEMSLKAVYSYRRMCTRRRQFTYTVREFPHHNPIPCWVYIQYNCIISYKFLIKHGLEIQL